MPFLSPLKPLNHSHLYRYIFHPFQILNVDLATRNTNFRSVLIFLLFFLLSTPMISSPSLALAADAVPKVSHQNASINIGEKIRDWRVSHPVTLVRTVTTKHGRVLVMAGGAYISSSYLKPLTFQANNSEGTEALDCVPNSASVCIECGEITCLALATLPVSEYAFGVAGTTHGSLVSFIVNGSTLHIVKELLLSSVSRGMVTATQSVRDVTIGVDPAGRVEFVAASSSFTAVVADVQHFVDEEAERCCGYSFGSTATESSSQRPLTESLVTSFSEASVVRLLCPTRYHAAFTMDIAVLIVLSNGNVRYVERRVSGGSVGLLVEHHRRRQGSSSAFGYRIAPQSDFSLEDKNDHLGHCLIPHVAYQYNLAPLAVETCRPYHNGSLLNGAVTVNDAALVYQTESGWMDLVLVGAQQQGSNGLSRSDPSLGLTSPLRGDAASGFARQRFGTLGAVSLGAGAVLSSAFSSSKLGSTGSNFSAWWATTERIVLPQGTLYSMSLRWCQRFHPEEHECTISDCVTSFSAPTLYRSDRLGGLGGSSGLSTLATLTASPSIRSPRAVVAMGSELFLMSFLPVQQPVAETSTQNEAAPTLPALQLLASTGGSVIEAVVVDLPHQLAPGTALDPFSAVAVSASGSTVTLWAL